MNYFASQMNLLHLTISSEFFFLSFCSHLIYVLAKPRKKRRDDENNQQEDLPLIEIARRILDASGLKGVVMNSQIFACLRMQMNKVLKSASKAMRAGGKSFKKLEECWKSGQKTYSFKVYFKEVDIISVTEENKILLEQKQKAEEELIKTRYKYRNLAVKEKSWKQKCVE